MNLKIVGLAVVLSAAGVASAGSTIKFLGTNDGGNVDIKFNGNSKTVFAGTLNFKNDSGTFFKTVCGDLKNSISTGQQYMVNAVNAHSVSASMGAAGNIVNKYLAGADTNTEGMALQLAVWEAIYDYNGTTTPDFGGGNFKAYNLSDTVKNKAKTFYMAVNITGGAIYFAPNPSNAGQGQLVPEPATMVALGAGALALLRRRRK